MGTESPIKINATLSGNINYAAAQWMSDTRRGSMLKQLQIKTAYPLQTQSMVATSIYNAAELEY